MHVRAVVGVCAMKVSIEEKHRICRIVGRKPKGGNDQAVQPGLGTAPSQFVGVNPDAVQSQIITPIKENYAPTRRNKIISRYNKNQTHNCKSEAVELRVCCHLPHRVRTSKCNS